MNELEFIVKLENVLGNLEVELREIYGSQDDIYSNEHIQTRELLQNLTAFRVQASKIGGKLLPRSEFDS